MNWKIYPSITSTQTQDGAVIWQDKLKETKQLGLKEVCIFPTQLDPEERQFLYQQLENSDVTYIPLVHMRHDETFEEVEYLMDRFGTRKFCIHPQKKNNYILERDFSKYSEYIYMENNVDELNDEPADWAGICLDTSHIENAKFIYPILYQEWQLALGKYPVGCWHLNAIDPVAVPHPFKNELYHDRHFYSSLNQLDYSTNYLQYLCEVVALELENSITEQLVAVEYLTKLFTTKIQG